MTSSRQMIGVIAAVTAIGVLLVDEYAFACGGCFHPPRENPTVVTDHRMIFAVSQRQTTLYDQMRYTGAPSSFAWVLPIAEKVTVGLSSDEMFGALDALSSVEVIPPPMNCFQPASCAAPPGGMPMSAAAVGGGEGGGVTILAHEVVGPYETVQLRATDPKALQTWLASHQYEVSKDAQAIIDGYVKEKSAFLAMKLVPGATVQAMRPVRVTAPGAGLTLPLRMVAAGAGATVGITLWVISDGRYEPQNFDSFTIDAADVEWDWSQNASTYNTVREERSKRSGNAAWQIESSLDVAPRTIESQIRYGAGSPPKPGAAADSGTGKSVESDRADDLATLFGGAPQTPPTLRVTRMRADLSRAALAKDLVVRASTQQVALSNVVAVTREKTPPTCPVYDQSCNIVGNAPRAEAEAKNRALRNPQYGGGLLGRAKRMCSCRVGPSDVSLPMVFGAAALVAVTGLRRRRRPR